MRPVKIVLDRAFVDGTLLHPAEPAGPAPGVLFIHGWGGSEQHYLDAARRIARLGCVCLTINLRGHQNTEHQREVVSRADNLTDVLEAYDLLAREEGVDPSRMGVAGSSYGGYLGAILTARRPVRWLSLRAPALYMDPGWELPKRQLNKDPALAAFRHRLVAPAESVALRSCAAFRGDALLVESQHDNVVPHPVAESFLGALAQARSVRHVVLAGADHGLSQVGNRRAYARVLIDWFRERLESSGAPEVALRGPESNLPTAS